MTAAAKAAVLALSGAAILAPLGTASAAASTPAAAPSLRAVQTDIFVLAAAGPNRYLQVPRAGREVKDAVEVVNRTAAPITLRLDAVDANKSASGIYGFGLPGRGFAAKVTLGSTEVPLAPHAQRVVPVDIAAPGGSGPEDYAAVTAMLDTGDNSGLTVASRLAVLIRLAGSPAAADPAALQGHPRPPVSLPEVAVGGGVAALAIAGGGWLLLLFCRRRHKDGPGTTAATLPVAERELIGV